MASAFISHSSAQKPLAREIRDALAQRGLEVWLDEADLRAGSLLRTELQRAVAARAALILLWSEQAADSRWVLAELLMGFHLDRQLLPCAVDNTPCPNSCGRELPWT